MESVTGRATYRVMPDKEAPLWNRYSRVIYWWTSDEAAADRAYRVSYNGGVHVFPKATRRGYWAARCVREPIDREILHVSGGSAGR